MEVLLFVYIDKKADHVRNKFFYSSSISMCWQCGIHNIRFLSFQNCFV